MSDTKVILFNYASRSRPERLIATITNIIRHLEDDRFIINLKLDEDDQTMKHKWVADVLALDHRIIINWGLSANKVAAINRDILTTGWDIIADVADDTVFTRKRFDNIIRQHCGPDDFVLFPEPYARSQAQKGRNEMISVMQVMGYDYYMRDKYIFHPSFKSLFCDNFATNVAKVRGRFKQVNEDIFYHAHPAAGYGKRDAQLQHTESFWNEDKIMYRNLMRRINEFK